MTPHRLGLVLVGGVLAACSVRENHPPTWQVDPRQIGQGQTLTLPVAPVDLDGDPVSVTVANVPDGLDVEVAGDSKSLTVHPLYQVSGAQTISVRLDDSHGGVTEVALDLTVSPIGWQWSQRLTDPAPTTREHGTFVVDAEHDLAYLIGGSGYAPQNTPATDALWTLDLNTRAWSVLTPTGDLPPPAASRRAANVPEQKVAWLFGGYDSDSSDTNDLYRFDYGSAPPRFTKVAQTNAPMGRELHGFGYDPQSDSFVTFGGYSYDGGVLGDTWTMKLAGDTATWSELTAPGPAPRYGFDYAVDPAQGTFYVWSGAQDPVSASDPINAAQDTWALDLRAAPPSWTRVLDGTEPGAPKGRRNGAFVFDPSGPRLVIFGGTADGKKTVPDLTLLDLRPGKLGWTTTKLANQPPIRSSDFGFYDATRQQIVMGFGNNPAPYRDLFALGY